MSKPRPQPPIRISLATGDALDYAADLAIVGCGRTLLQRVEQASGSRFERLDYPPALIARHGAGLDGLRNARLLLSPAFRWQATVSMCSRPSRRLRKRFREELLDMLVVAVRLLLRPRRVLLVPFHREPASGVALNLLFLAWCMARVRLARWAPHALEQIRIVAADDVSIFRHLVETTDGQAGLQAFCAHQAGLAWGLGRFDQLPPPCFEIAAD